MEAVSAADLLPDELENKIARLHFFKEVGSNDRQQLSALVDQSRLISAKPGETLLKAGERDTWLYFLMRGELQVCAPGQKGSPLGKLIAGEVFGDISVITNSARQTDIIVPENGRMVSVLALDFSLMADMQDHSRVSCETKLIIYRQIAHMLRWRSDLYRIKFPKNSLAHRPYKMMSSPGNQNPQSELLVLRAYAEYLANRLQNLNEQLGAVDSGLQSTVP